MGARKCGRRRLSCRACSVRTVRRCCSPKISIRSVTSVQTVGTNRCAEAFARGLGGGIVTAVMPASARAASNDVVNCRPGRGSETGIVRRDRRDLSEDSGPVARSRARRGSRSRRRCVAPRFPDSCLVGCFMLQTVGSDTRRRPRWVSCSRALEVETFLIITEFDVARNVGHGVSAGGVHCAVDAFVLEHAKERFSHGVIETDPGAPDGLPDVEGFQGLGELSRRVVAAAVGVKPKSV